MLFTRAGFSNVKYGIMKVDDEPPITLDFYIKQDEIPRRGGCYAIGKDCLVQKDDEIISTRNTDIKSDEKFFSTENRKYLRDVIYRCYLANQPDRESRIRQYLIEKKVN